MLKKCLCKRGSKHTTLKAIFVCWVCFGPKRDDICGNKAPKLHQVSGNRQTLAMSLYILFIIRIRGMKKSFNLFKMLQ